MRWLSYWYLRTWGWSFAGSVPDIPKMIVIGAPHTSNWDFIFFLGALHHFKINVRYLGKSQLFRRPFGWIFRAVGGIPVDRARAGGIVGQVKSEFERSGEMILVVAPEGTRSSTTMWKSGFMKIAEAAEVPLVLAGVDGPSKTITMGPTVHVGPDVMTTVRSFYETQMGFKPDKKGPIRLKGESLSS